MIIMITVNNSRHNTVYLDLRTAAVLSLTGLYSLYIFITTQMAPPHKRVRTEVNEHENDGDHDDSSHHQENNNNHNELSVFDSSTSSSAVPSSLPCPTLKLTGHKGSIYALAYSPSGDALVTASFDRTCLLWDSSSSYANVNQLTTHKNAVLDVCWVDHTHIVTAGADKTLQLHDVHTGQRVRKWTHDKIVNACSTTGSLASSSTTTTGSHVVASACDDGKCRLWDVRQRNSIAVLESASSSSSSSSSAFDMPTLPMTAVALSDTAVYTGGLDNLIVSWDWKMTHKKLYALKGHTDTITGLALHPEGTHLLSNSMDQTLQSWDVRPFVASENGQQQAKRHVQTFRGHKHAAEKGLLKCSWSADGTMVSCGSADRLVHIWDVYSGEELYVLPGHQGCVNAVTFHPKLKNVVASGSSDHNVLVGELS